MNAQLTDVAMPVVGGWRRVVTHPRLMHYHWLVAVVVLLNVGIAAAAMQGGRLSVARFASGLVLANLSAAVMMRQQYIINALFWLATRAPTAWPLWIRWHLGKVYHFGGLHSGCAGAATAWFALLTVDVTGDVLSGRQATSAATLVVTWLLMALLLAIVATAMPRLRARFHNRFEAVHRFGGWAALLLVWVQTLLVADDGREGQPFAEALAGAPTPWLLLLLTFSIALPWLRLRRLPVTVVKPSSHAAIVGFTYKTPFAGSSTAISLSPLLEWHSFANVPAPGRAGFRLIISRAGDWTGQFIDRPPTHVWVKGITTAGVANIEVLFKRVVYVATGSGIGPVLPHLLARQVPVHLIWSTRSPRQTYGDELVDEILASTPDALIWDTDQRGKPDLVRLAYEAWRSFGAEAVICISNQKLTYAVVHAMESRGIPAFGAIWDS